MLDQLHPIKIRKQLFVSIVLLTALVVGCSSSKLFLTEEKAKSEQIKEKKLPLLEYETTLNPIEYDKEIEIVQKARGEEQKEQNPLEIPKDSVIVQEEVVQGFRIQIFSSSNVD
jgi:hypothetical protein